MKAMQLSKIFSFLLSFVLVLSIFLTASSNQAFACSCIPSPDPKTAMGESDAVFSGTVSKKDGTQDGVEDIKVTFDVDQVWKGAVNDGQTVKTAGSSASCGFNFEESKKYIAYVTRDESGEFSASLCSRTAALSDATEDLEILGDGHAPLPAAEPKEMDETGKSVLWIFIFVLVLGIAAASYSMSQKNANSVSVKSSKSTSGGKTTRKPAKKARRSNKRKK